MYDNMAKISLIMREMINLGRATGLILIGKKQVSWIEGRLILSGREYGVRSHARFASRIGIGKYLPRQKAQGHKFGGYRI